MSTSRFAGLIAGLLLPVLCVAQTPDLQIPSLAPLQRDAVESVNVTFGPMALGFFRFISRFADDHDAHSAAARKVIGGLQRVQVHNFRFATDHSAAEAGDVAALRSQLAGPGWRRLVEVRKPSEGQHVDVYYVPTGDHSFSQMAVLVAEPREFTLVHIVGVIDLDEIAALQEAYVHHGAGPVHAALAPDTDQDFD